MQRCQLRRVRQEELLQQHDVDVIRERCFLLGETPDTHPEYLAALARVRADLGPPPMLRVIEPPAALAKLHRQGVPAPARHACTLPGWGAPRWLVWLRSVCLGRDGVRLHSSVTTAHNSVWLCGFNRPMSSSTRRCYRTCTRVC